MSVVSRSVTASEALDYLAVRTVPATRLVLLDLDRWTGVLTNHRDGSDFNDHQYWAARTVQARTVRVVDHDARWWPRGQLRERLAWEARIFELHAPDDSPLRLAHRAECWIKTVPCAGGGYGAAPRHWLPLAAYGVDIGPGCGGDDAVHMRS